MAESESGASAPHPRWLHERAVLLSFAPLPRGPTAEGAVGAVSVGIARCWVLPPEPGLALYLVYPWCCFTAH